MKRLLFLRMRKRFCRSRRRPLGVTVGLTGQAAGGGCLSPSIVIQNSLNPPINCNFPSQLSAMVLRSNDFCGIRAGLVVFTSVSVFNLFRPDVHLIVPFVSCFQTYSRLANLLALTNNTSCLQSFAVNKVPLSDE